MFKKILIANRGEISCRVIKTAKKMGIQTVAVFSEADRHALHVKHADEAVYIGPPAATESYLVIEKIIEACKQTGAQAVHPGYGFLSENANFAKALAEENITFIGPPIEAIEIMGDKIASKQQAKEAGVSTVPGYIGIIEDVAHAREIASSIGYPVMIKASAGGGGKGMRIAWEEKDVQEGFERSKSEAASSFGDDRIFIEKFVVQPRHIEIQVLGDTHGHIIHLGERECSIQRRNQKVIEEAPSPFLDEALRQKMGAQAVELAKSVGYFSAGTVEFIVDPAQNFYFLEMNTRLQVEHPVTELITGIDLVEQMIRIAAGEKLALTQDSIALKGWALESRIYAEDPYRNFLPSTGRLTKYNPPAESTDEQGETIRNDTGVYEGSEISIYYDPMIAKLCTWASDRDRSIEKMLSALDEFEVDGIGHNVPFLSAVIDHKAFRAGDISTGFIAEHYKDGFTGVELSENTKQYLAIAAVVMKFIDMQRILSIGDAQTLNQTKLVAKVYNQLYELSIKNEGPEFVVDLEGDTFLVGANWSPGKTLAHFRINNETITLKVRPTAIGYHISHRGDQVEVSVLPPRVMELAAWMPEKRTPDMSKYLLCPMPGCVTTIMVTEGDRVEEGQPLAIVEAMKMENVLRAERQATVAKIRAEPNTNLAVDEVIMEFE